MSTLNDEFELLSPVNKTQRAFEESAEEHTIADVKLNVWTCARHGVAIQMGSQVIQAIGPHLDAFMEGGNYPNRFRDVVIVLWLSHLDRGEIKNLCALPNPEHRVIEAYEWAESIGATFGSALFFEGIRILDRIVRDILSSVFAIDHESDTPAMNDKKKDINPVGKFNTPSGQSGAADITPILSSTKCLSLTLSNGGLSGCLPEEKTALALSSPTILGTE